MELAVPEVMHQAPSDEARAFFHDANFLVVKLTDYCNLRCTYCHQDALNGHPVLMPMETYKNAVRLILKSSVAPEVNVQFHGGEPLLQPDEFFREAVAFARAELEGPKRRVNFFIQTNLTKLNAERQNLLQELEIGISFSLDGPPEINDSMRGGGKIIIKNFRRLKAAGVEAGTICLIQPTNWDRMPEVLAYFREEGLTNVRFNMMVPDGRGVNCDSGTTEKLFNARKVILQQMLEHGSEAVVDAVLYNQMKRFVKPNGAPSSTEYQGCEALYCQAGRSLYSLNPDGSFYACDRIAEHSRWTMGSVNAGFEEKERDFAQKGRSAFHHKDEWWARCETCDARKICEFSCSAYYVDKVDTREVECAVTKRVWTEMVERKDSIFQYMRERTPPLEIHADVPIHKQAQENWVIRDFAADAFFDNLSLVVTEAANPRFKLLRYGEQHFLYLHESERIFEIDDLVAEIARYNGALSPRVLAGVLNGKYPRGTVKESLATLRHKVPELFAHDAASTREGGGSWLSRAFAT